MIFNPFNIQNMTDEILVGHIKELLDACDDDADTINGLSENVLIFTDVIYIYGELLSRVQEKYSLTKYQNSIEETKLAYKLKSETEQKYPISYFNALAQEKLLEKRKNEFELQRKTTELKYAYDATQEKINALKKKIESIKYENNY